MIASDHGSPKGPLPSYMTVNTTVAAKVNKYDWLPPKLEHMYIYVTKLLFVCVCVCFFFFYSV